MHHWVDKDTWFNVPTSSINNFQTEVWHGQRFSELSYFWDSSKETLLPEKCSSCSQIICSEVIANHLAEPETESVLSFKQIDVQCPHCKSMQLIVPQYMVGDPRNQAILIHEDGWNPHIHWGHHSIGAITITHGCMNKVERSDGSNALVYSFIPVHQLPN